MDSQGKMTLDEAITHARKIAEENYLQGMLCHSNPNDEELDGCIECAKEHEQLAEWLEELKLYRSVGTLEEVRDAVEKQIPKKMVIIGCEEKRIARCPSCSRNMAVAYLRDGEILGTQCIGDVPNVANYCKFCGQALLLDWSEEND